MTEVTADKSTNKLGICEVCGAQAAKYACPKCEVKTCCLTCVNIHKKELNCDGIRDPTKFIPLNNFTNVDLLNDYRMLENVNRVVETLHKTKRSYSYKGGRKFLPKNLSRLKSALYQQKIRINFLPESFQKRIYNKTYLHRTKNLVFWDIEWIFPNADNIKHVDHSCKETSSLCSLLQKYFSGNDLKDQLSFYQSAGIAGVVLLLKAEYMVGNKYYELDKNLSIRENLSGKSIIEYPTILVVLKGHEMMYDIVNEMDEGVSLEKSANEGEAVIMQLLNTADKDEKSNNNLLFMTEYSDIELSADEENT